MNTELLQDRTRAAIEWSRELRTKDNIDVHTLNQTLLAFQFNQLLEAISFDKIKTDIEKSPKEFLEVARTVAEQGTEHVKRVKAELELQTYRDEVAERKRKLQETISASKTGGGISPEVIQEIEEVMATL
jgi:hypothetical protein